MTQAAFLTLLYADQQGFIDCRAIDLKTNQIKTEFFPVGDVESVAAFCARWRHRNNYVAVATRRDSSSGGLGNCATLPALFAEFDGGDTPEIRTRRRAFPLEPSIMVLSSPGKQHCYWLLKEALDLQNGGEPIARRLLKQLALILGADPQAAEPARVLRLPDTLNYKYDPPARVQLERLHNIRYSRFDIEDSVAIALLVGAWPPKAAHSRHEARLALAGFLLGHRLAVERARTICVAVAEATYGDARDAEAVIRDTADKLKAGQDVTGGPRLAEKLTGDGPQVVKQLRVVLDIKPREFPITDVGNAEFFVEQHEDHVRFEHRQKRFYIFQSHHWRPDESEEIRRLAVDGIRHRQRRAAAIEDADQRKRALQKLVKCESTRDITNLLNETHNLVAMFAERWDTAPYLIGVLNGVVDLGDGGRLRRGRPEDHITRVVPVTYDPEMLDLIDTERSPCPSWDLALARIFPDADLRACFDRALGYTITGDCREECWFFCYGTGANGKGTTMNTIASVLGPDYWDNLSVRSLVQRAHGDDEIPTDLAKLAGKRYVTAAEPNVKVRLNEARIKQLTGRDPITARFMRRDEFTFIPMMKLWFAANHKPTIYDTSDGFWRRVIFFPFRQSFKDAPDQTLKDRLLAERDGIFARMVRGCLAWQTEGLNPPAAVRAAVAAYRDESRPLADYIAAQCIVAAGSEIRASDLYADYVWWAGGKEHALSFSMFGRLMKERFEDKKKETGRFYLGVALRESTPVNQETRDDLPY